MGNNTSICYNGDKKSWQCREKTLCWWQQRWRVSLAVVGSRANESERWKMIGEGRWSEQLHILQWWWEKRDWEKVTYRHRDINPAHVLLLNILTKLGRQEKKRMTDCCETRYWWMGAVDGRMTIVLFRRMRHSIFFVNNIVETSEHWVHCI